MIPKRLLRFFEKQEHAEQFVSGNIRIGEISWYKCIEDARRDPLEGIASFTWDINAPELIIDSKTGKIIGSRLSAVEKIKCDLIISYPLYLLCTTSVRVNKVAFAKKYGYSCFVEINNSIDFLKLLDKSWAQKPYSFGNVELKKVTYDRGTMIKRPNEYLQAPRDITYTQKSIDYKDDREYRFVFLCKNDANLILENHLYLNIGPNADVIKKKIQIISQRK